MQLPISVGVGWDDYYGRNTNEAIFGQAGITASIPLRFVPASYGSWDLSVGGDVIARSRDVRRTSRFDRDDTTILIGRAAITFKY